MSMNCKMYDMKYLSFFMLFILGTSSVAFAQSGKVLSCWNATNLYENGGGPEDLERGKQPIDEAILDPSTMNQSKTWWYRAKLYSLMLQDKTLSPKYPDLMEGVVTSFKKLAEINDPKFREWEDAGRFMQGLVATLFNSALDAFNGNDFSQAHKGFMLAADLVTVLEARKLQTPVSVADCYRNAALSAENAKDINKAEEAVAKLISVSPDAKSFNLLAYYQKRNNKVEQAKATIENGLSKFPQDLDLLIAKIQFFLDEKKEGEAITYLNEAIQIDPKNGKLYLVLGNAYDQVGKAEESRAAYEKCIEIDPTSFDAYYNIASVINNKAVKVNEEMNNLGNTAADQKKYDELKKKRNEYFMQAKPYLLKARELRPDDSFVNKFLKQIELYTAE